MPKIQLVLVDKRECILQGFAKLLSAEPSLNIVSTADVWEKTTKECEAYQPNVILMYYDSYERSSIEDIKALHERLPRSNVALIVDRMTTDQFISCVMAGVRVFLSSRIRITNLVAAITLAAEGKIIVSPDISTQILERMKSIYMREDGGSLEGATLLSSREKAVLELVRRGLTNKEIAVTLGISDCTVKVHMRNVMEKLHAHTRQEAVNLLVHAEIVYGVHLN